MKQIIINKKIFESKSKTDDTFPLKVKKNILAKRTSLGDNEIFPPDDETEFQYSLVKNEYISIKNEIQKKFSNEIDINDCDYISKQIGNLLTKCKKIEEQNKETLEKLCAEIVNKLFNIPEGVIELHCELVNNIDVSKERIIPDKTDDFEFNDVESAKKLNKEIYKRRAINSLMAGISNIYSSDIKQYVNEIYSIDSRLPLLYEEILLLNNFLLYNLVGENMSEKYNAGNVEVEIYTNNKQSKIKSYGVIFPVLLNETIKGILELISSNGLPDEKSNAEYVLKKSDFKLAEEWDIVFGIPMWRKIEKNFNSDINEFIGAIFYEISTMNIDEFNNFMRENLLSTKVSKKIDKDIIEKIINNKKYSDFQKFSSIKNSEYDNFVQYINDENSDYLEYI